ncbi:MAG: alkaline phosphatase family protein [Rikenellaceae bacterium]
MIKKIILSILAAAVLCSAWGQSRATPPRIVVNIVVGAMRSGDIERYRENFSSDGFLRLLDGGVNYKSASYNLHQTITPATLSTIFTGTLPSTHGVVGEEWWEYTLGSRVDLVADREVRNLDYNLRDWGYSASKLVAPTLSEALLLANPNSKSVSIAVEPTSAIVMNGRGGVPYWIDSLTCEWGSSTAFVDSLSRRVVEYNKSPEMQAPLRQKWVSMLTPNFYKNGVSTALMLKSPTRRYEAAELPRTKSRDDRRRLMYEQLAYTPAGNSVIFNYAKELIESMDLGGDEHPDILNIYLDPARNIAQRYGVQSIEVEDMYLHLDAEIRAFVAMLAARMHVGDMVITLTSDHGISAVCDESQMFNTQQFVMLIGGFLRAQYGVGNWVLGYKNCNLYLNHQLILEQGLSISDIQDEVAAFALQFRGVSHVLTASAMRSGYFGGGYGQKMQSSFSPSRSGDVVLNFMPGWIEQREGVVANSGSMYRYDNDVPLIIYATGYSVSDSVSRDVSMIDFATTLSSILNIEPPAAAEGRVLNEFAE